MPLQASRRPGRLRRNAALANANAALWAVGNGLVSSTLVIFLAIELGAAGAAIGLLRAAPRFVGGLRLAAPWAAAKLRRRKAACVGFLLTSGALLLGLGCAVLGGAVDGAARGVLVTLVAVWAAYHLLEFWGVVLLWAWLGDLFPARVRGRLIGRRESWLTIGRIAGLIVSFSLTWGSGKLWPETDRSWAMWCSATLGAVLLIGSVLPLLAMSDAAASRQTLPASSLRGLMRGVFRSLADRGYRRLLTFSCAFAVANGLTNVAQYLYPGRVLGIRYEQMLVMRGGMRGGQAWLAGWAGARIDRYGARGMMFFAQLVVATGPLFFLLAAPGAKWWVAGAFVVWVAYAVLNVGLDEQKITLAPPPEDALSGARGSDRSIPIALYHSVSDVVNGVVVVAGGLLFDLLSAGGSASLGLYARLFLAGWIARTCVAALILRLPDRRGRLTPRPAAG